MPLESSPLPWNDEGSASDLPAVTLDKVDILGIFEDAAQRDFHLGLIERCGEDLDLRIAIVTRLTDGCRFDFLAEHLHLSAGFDGTLVGVDGKKKSSKSKIGELESGLTGHGISDLPHPLLWSIATPSIEEWLMADLKALPRVLRETFGADNCMDADRPGSAKAEQTAKQRLAEWTLGILGSPLARRGREYAERVGYETSRDRVGASRNPDLKELLTARLPEFLNQCRQD